MSSWNKENKTLCNSIEKSWTLQKLYSASALHEQWIQTKVDLANDEHGMAMVRNAKLPLSKTILLYYRNWTPWTAK